MKPIFLNQQSTTITGRKTPILRRLVSVMTGSSAKKAAFDARTSFLRGGFAPLFAGSDRHSRVPEVPADIAVSPHNKAHFHGFGHGVQIYTWDGSSWGSAVPESVLEDAEGHVVATHFAGPSWESISGSKVVGSEVAPRVIRNPTAIPWLLFCAVATEGPGIFAITSYIQRVNTTGGKAPSVAGTAVGQVARVPYTADYFFYRKTHY